MHISDQKEKLRQEITTRLRQMTPAERHAQGRSISRRLLPLIPTGSQVCAYFPLKTEADIRPLILTLLKRSDTVFLPRFKNMKITFGQIKNLTDLVSGELSIPEPALNVAAPDPEKLDYVIVPGRAFDRRGNRLGRGAGGYDHWIKKQRSINPKIKFIGVCYECQLVNELPTEEHDQKMDMVITARGVVT